MASVVRSFKSRFWIAAFRDASGRQHRRSTREVDKKRALAVAQQFEKVAKRQGSPQRVRQVFSEFFREHYGQDVPFTTVANYSRQWLSARKAEISPSTHRRYNDTITKFLDFLGSHAQRGLDEITKTQVGQFRDSILAATSAATSNHALKIIKMLMRSARLEGCLFVDPAEGVKPAKNEVISERRAFTLDELRSVLEVVDDEWRSMVMFGVYTGQRLADIATLTWAQIDLVRDEIRLVTRKTHRRLVIPLAPPLREHLLTLAGGDNPSAPLHPRATALITAHGGRVMALSNQFGELLATAGLRESRNHRSRGIGRSSRRERHALSFHSLRHTAVSLLKDAGIPHVVVQALIGHESAAVSQRYTHVGLEALQRAARSLPEI
jgi:integrase